MSAFLALTLIGCATSGTINVPFPELPSDLQTCFDHVVPAPGKGELTKKQIIELIAKLKLSEAEKTACGKRLITFYESLQKHK